MKFVKVKMLLAVIFILLTGLNVSSCFFDAEGRAHLIALPPAPEPDELPQKISLTFGGANNKKSVITTIPLYRFLARGVDDNPTLYYTVDEQRFKMMKMAIKGEAYNAVIGLVGHISPIELPENQTLPLYMVGIHNMEGYYEIQPNSMVLLTSEEDVSALIAETLYSKKKNKSGKFPINGFVLPFGSEKTHIDINYYIMSKFCMIHLHIITLICLNWAEI